jgi:hypothetical protein
MMYGTDWKMPGLEFVEEGHKYLFNGNEVPSVTQVMSDTGLVNFSGVSESLLNNRAEFGKMAHLYTAYRDLGILDEMSVPAPMIPVLDAWEKFKKDHGVIVKMVEQPIASRIWQFACTPDRVAEVDGKLSLIEFKTTSTIAKSVKWQLAGQQVCCEEHGIAIEDRWVVCVSPEGELTTAVYGHNTYRKDKSVITSAVTIYKAKRGE